MKVTLMQAREQLPADRKYDQVEKLLKLASDKRVRVRLVA